MSRRSKVNKLKYKYNAPTVDAGGVIDDAALIKMIPPRQSKTYGEYCNTEITGKIKRFAAYVCACVCVCVCLYSSTVKASSVCKMSETYLRVRINDVVL